MGAPRRIPRKLGKKLLQVRSARDLTQSQMAESLSDKSVHVYKQDVQKFESNQREPSLIVLLRYSRIANMPMEFFADDEVDSLDRERK